MHLLILQKHNALTALDEWFEKSELSEDEAERYQNIRQRMVDLLKKG
jgi:hypothetical protein